jgi:hypothetical protein
VAERLRGGFDAGNAAQLGRKRVPGPALDDGVLTIFVDKSMRESPRRGGIGIGRGRPRTVLRGAVNLAIGPDARLRLARVKRWKLGHRGEGAMAKPRKPNAARKPPVPSDSHADIEEWIRRVMPDLDPIVKRLDELICETIPGLQYAVKWKKAYYGLPELGWIIEMVAYDVSVNVVFFGGAEFDPPPPLGTTERTRYVKVKTLEEAQGPEMHKWIEQAARMPGWK